jgi:hypothetical protein
VKELEMPKVQLALALSFTLIAADFASAAEPVKNLDKVLSKLDEIARRIEALEERVLRLESKLDAIREIPGTRPVGSFFVDEHGFLYDQTGRRIGIWGVDGPADMER